MNLDDLMAVWRSQDVSPLHGVDKTLLHLALRQDNAKLQKERRTERWFMYALTAFVLAFMGFFLASVIAPQGENVRTFWDYAVPVVGAAASLVMGSAEYVARRAQTAREQGFGESLRDQLAHRIAQLDDLATRGVRLKIVVGVAGTICGLAMFFAGVRMNDHPYSEGRLLKGLIFVSFGFLLTWWEYRSRPRDILPRKRRLEALLKELDG